jgi:hypothetical protein
MTKIKLARIAERLVTGNTIALKPRTSLLTSFVEFAATLVTLLAIVPIVRAVLTIATCRLPAVPCRMTSTDSWMTLMAKDPLITLAGRLAGTKELATQMGLPLGVLHLGLLEEPLVGPHHGHGRRTLEDPRRLLGQIADLQAITMIPAPEVVVRLHGPEEEAVEEAAAVAAVEELHHGNPTTIKTTGATRVMAAMVRVAMEVMAMANKAMVTRAPDTDRTEMVARTTDTKTNATRIMVATAAINLRHLRHQPMSRLRLPQAISPRHPRLLERTDCAFSGLPTRLGCL